MLPSGCFTEHSRLKAIIFSRTSGTLQGDGKDDARSLSTQPLYPDRIQDMKDIIAQMLQIPSYSIDTVLYTRNMKDKIGHDETTAMGKILVSFNPDTGNDPNNPQAAYEVWAGAVVQNGLATVDDSEVAWPIMYDSWFCEDLIDPSRC